MKKINTLLNFGVFLISTTSFAESLPIISSDQLNVGRHWTWTYYTNGDINKPYSSERYEVIETHGSNITFEMKSRYNSSDEFVPTTRFKLDLLKCQQAFQDPKVKVNFLIQLFPLANGSWEKDPIWTHSTAFEEKFNCNPIVHKSKNSIYETHFDSTLFNGSKESLFQQWPKFPQSQLRSFYFMSHPKLKGVAFRKSFNTGTSSHYEMQLTDWSE